jgi:hypothetical protein
MTHTLHVQTRQIAATLDGDITRIKPHRRHVHCIVVCKECSLHLGTRASLGQTRGHTTQDPRHTRVRGGIRHGLGISSHDLQCQFRKGVRGVGELAKTNYEKKNNKTHLCRHIRSEHITPCNTQTLVESGRAGGQRKSGWKCATEGQLFFLKPPLPTALDVTQGNKATNKQTKKQYKNTHTRQNTATDTTRHCTHTDLSLVERTRYCESFFGWVFVLAAALC